MSEKEEIIDSTLKALIEDAKAEAKARDEWAKFYEEQMRVRRERKSRPDDDEAKDSQDS